MSEEDYQRGLRGGDAPVSMSEWDRWKDWKAGHDEYERAQEEEDEALIAEFSTPEQNLARFEEGFREREKKRDEKLAALDRADREWREAEKRRAERSGLGCMVLVFVTALCFIGGLIA